MFETGQTFCKRRWKLTKTQRNLDMTQRNLTIAQKNRDNDQWRLNVVRTKLNVQRKRPGRNIIWSQQEIIQGLQRKKVSINFLTIENESQYNYAAHVRQQG